MGFSLTGVVLAFGGLKMPARRRKKPALMVIAGVLLGVVVACGGGGSSSGSTKSGVGHPGTPAGSYTITVTGSVGSVSRSTQVMLTV
jgi:ABC-type glycerol-3-phosphate transport system substrate-binding protein